MVIRNINEKDYAKATGVATFDPAILIKELEKEAEDLDDITEHYSMNQFDSTIKCVADEVEVEMPEYTIDDIKNSMKALSAWIDSMEGFNPDNKYEEYYNRLSADPAELPVILSSMMLGRKFSYYKERQLEYQIERHYCPAKYMKLAEFDELNNTIILYTTTINKLYSQHGEVPLDEYKKIFAHEVFIAGLFGQWGYLPDWTSPRNKETIVYESLATLFEERACNPNPPEKWFGDYYEDTNHIPYAGAYPLYLAFMCSPGKYLGDSCDLLISNFLSGKIMTEEEHVKIYEMYVTFCNLHGLYK